MDISQFIRHIPSKGEFPQRNDIVPKVNFPQYFARYVVNYEIMLEKNKKLLCLYRIKNIGGNVLRNYNRLKSETDNVDSNIFELCAPFLRELEIDVPKYIKIAEKGLNAESYLQKMYSQRKFEEYLQDIEEGNPSKLQKYKKYEDLKKAKKGIQTIARKEFQTKTEETRKERLYPKRWDKMVIGYFVDCLILDPEDGLLIDGYKFLDKYDSITKAQQSQRHELHVQAVEAINNFFQGYVITWEEMERYFVISNGRVLINPKTENNKDYMRLDL